MLLPVKINSRVSRVILKVKQNLLNSLSRERDAQEQTQRYGFLPEAEVRVIEEQKPGSSAVDIEMEESLSGNIEK
jgi:phage portal protein BeeE